MISRFVYDKRRFARQFVYDFKRSVVDDKELWDKVNLTQVWAATPHESKNETTCFHGKKECDFETYLVCSQKLFGDENTLLWNECVDGDCDGDYKQMKPCKTQYVNPSNDTLMETCGYGTLGSGFKYDDLKSCATSATGQDLLLQNAQKFNFKYGLQGLPVVEVNGKVVSTFFSCHVSMTKVIDAICSNLKDPKPQACTSELKASSNCDAGSMIKRHEGVRKCVYVDTTGHHTIGVGFNLDASGAKSACEAAGIDYDAVYSGSKCLTDSQVDSLFSLSMKQAESSARADVSSYDSLCCNVQNVVTDMVRLLFFFIIDDHTHIFLISGIQSRTKRPREFFQHDSIHQ